MVRMLSEGTLESQHAVVQSVVQYAVTKQACDQLVESEFLEEIISITVRRYDFFGAHAVVLHLLVVSSGVTLFVKQIGSG
jgi:hypothetical protein